MNRFGTLYLCPSVRCTRARTSLAHQPGSIALLLNRSPVHADFLPLIPSARPQIFLKRFTCIGRALSTRINKHTSKDRNNSKPVIAAPSPYSLALLSLGFLFFLPSPCFCWVAAEVPAASSSSRGPAIRRPGHLLGPPTRRLRLELSQMRVL